MEAIANFLNPFIGLVGALNLLIILSVSVWAIIIAVAMFAMREIFCAYQKWQARCEAESRREAEALIGADATPSLMYQGGNGNDGGVSGMFLAVCANGGVPDIVENAFHDFECAKPCIQHTECELAH